MTREDNIGGIVQRNLRYNNYMFMIHLMEQEGAQRNSKCRFQFQLRSNGKRGRQRKCDRKGQIGVQTDYEGSEELGSREQIPMSVSSLFLSLSLSLFFSLSFFLF